MCWDFLRSKIGVMAASSSSSKEFLRKLASSLAIKLGGEEVLWGECEKLDEVPPAPNRYVQ